MNLGRSVITATFDTAFAEIPCGGDKPKSLGEAKRSLESPEWEHAVQTELDQLQQMGTWRYLSRSPQMLSQYPTNGYS